jgi:hypothetical protein
MKPKLLSLTMVLALIIAFAMSTLADVPAPPANQTIGIYDGIFNDTVEEDCRLCHEDPDIVSGESYIPNRHHLLMNSSIQTGECSVNRDTCLSDNDCDSGICSRNNVPCSVDSDCPESDFGEVCGEICIGETVAKDIDSDNDGVNDTTYECLNCHTVSIVGGIIEMIVWRDCNECHVQIPGEASIHHLTQTAQGTDSPLGDPDVGDCTPCHGDLVDDIGDGHTIPTYDPSLVTPSTSGGDGEPLNSYGNYAGACDYCHDQDTMPPTAPIDIFANDDTHHNTGVFMDEVGVFDQGKCLWCHLVNPPVVDALNIRTCEGCHGYESLHNVQADSPDPDNLGVIDVGAETAGYGHIGNNDDCWGCHGFDQSTAPGSGPVVPFISSSDVLSMPAGTDTAVTLSGSAFTNTYFGIMTWTSNVVLTAADGATTELTPDSIGQSSLTVTIPGTTATGNYDMRVVKNGTEESNPIVISVTPELKITQVKCMKRRGRLTIMGSGFGEKPEGTDAYMNVEVNGETVDVISWKDSRIKASISSCSSVENVTVNALYGSASAGTDKPPKPTRSR